MSGLDLPDTPAFHTLDPLEAGDIDATCSTLSTDGPLTELPDSVRSRLLEEGADLDNLTWDHATVLFVAFRAKAEDGAPAEPLDRGISMERLGRFPTSDGNAIGYLRRHLNAPEGTTVHPLLLQLDAGFRAETRGDDVLSEGFGGLRLHGWLDAQQVGELRKSLQTVKWGVDPDEPLDGGVRDVVRHLLILLKSAEKRGCGVLMRAHA